MVLGEGAFGQHRLPAFVPCVGRLAPPGGVFGVMDAGGRVGGSLELPAGLEPWPGGQVGPRVALHVDEAALDARARPCLGAGLADAFHAVADEHVGRCDLFGQGLVGGCALTVAPLPGEHLAVLAVDRDQQAPAVHVGAVGHDRMMHHTVGFDARGEPRHQPTRLRKLRALSRRRRWGAAPSSQSRNSSSWHRRALSALDAVGVSAHVAQRRR